MSDDEIEPWHVAGLRSMLADPEIASDPILGPQYRSRLERFERVLAERGSKTASCPHRRIRLSERCTTTAEFVDGAVVSRNLVGTGRIAVECLDCGERHEVGDGMDLPGWARDAYEQM